MAMDRSSTGLAIVRLCLGVFFVFEGLGKLGWLADAGPLGQQLAGWLASAQPLNRWYLERVAIPAAPLLGRLVMLAEFAAGCALIVGFRTRLVALLALVMVLNFHFASGLLFQYRFLTSGYALPVLGGLAGLAIGGGRLPWSVRR